MFTVTMPWSNETPIEEYFVFIHRVLANLGERVGDADPEALREMVELREELETHIETAIRKLRNNEDLPATWTDIGEAMGITRENACRKYGHVGGARQPGGQPGNWR